MSVRTLSLEKRSDLSNGLLSSKNSNKNSDILTGLCAGRVARRISMEINTLKINKLGSFLSSRSSSKESLLLGPKSVFCKASHINSPSKKQHAASDIIKNKTRIRWKDMKIPLSPLEVLENFRDFLPDWEQEEIKEYPSIYYIGKNLKQKKPVFDDIEGNYNIFIKDHIAYRYQIIGIIGRGTFGQVIEVYDHCESRSVALKIIKNKNKFNRQAKIEIEILELIKEVDTTKESNIIEILTKFEFRGHIFIVFELYSLNLYEMLRKNYFKGLSISFIKKIAVQLLRALSVLERCNVIHCDIKPENILLTKITRTNIKLIDLGSSCFANNQIYSYIQSRYYRAPEIILGIPYTNAIDIWSLGCVLAELFTGNPLFAGEDEADQLMSIMQVLGVPGPELLEVSKRKTLFFDCFGAPLSVSNSKIKRVPESRSLKNILKGLDEELYCLVESCLRWNPELRIKPLQALESEWLSEKNQESALRKNIHKKISMDDITKRAPNLKKFIAHRQSTSDAFKN